MMFALRANDVAFESDVYFVNDVMPDGIVSKFQQTPETKLSLYQRKWIFICELLTKNTPRHAEF